jgi:hypothetical protein
MICHRQRLVFVHLRRTAGNSIEAALGGILLFDRWFRPTDAWDNRRHRGRSWYKRDRRGHRIHATAAEIRGRYPREFDSYFKFTIVRNPWAQMASLYGRLHPHDAPCAGFRDWLRGFALLPGTVPQASLSDDAGRCLVDFVGRFERLQEDFDTACDRAGIPRRALPRTNPGGGPALAAVYDDETRDRVARLFAADIARFGYTFEAAIGPTRQAA